MTVSTLKLGCGTKPLCKCSNLNWYCRCQSTSIQARRGKDLSVSPKGDAVAGDDLMTSPMGDTETDHAIPNNKKRMSATHHNDCTMHIYILFALITVQSIRMPFQEVHHFLRMQGFTITTVIIPHSNVGIISPGCLSCEGCTPCISMRRYKDPFSLRRPISGKLLQRE